MKTGHHHQRIVVVLGPASPELEPVLRALGLAPVDDDRTDATLWVPEGRFVADASMNGWIGEATPAQALLTTAEVALALRLGLSTVYELICRGELELVHLGRALRIPEDSVQSYVDRRSGDLPNTGGAPVTSEDKR